MKLEGKIRKGQMKVWALMGTEDYGVETTVYTVKRKAESAKVSGLRARMWIEEIWVEDLADYGIEVAK